MKLDVYRRKRNFERTPEPSGQRTAARGRFRYVIQKHAARRLHYDLRLELNGTLKSWAVPRGPSLDPKEKRLAVHVEDHPIEYGRFEGVIPKNQYGAGAVLVWDRGVWKPEGDPDEAYRKGHLRFALEGEKLHGRFSLVRSGRSSGDKENWLLIKHDDEFASSVEITEAMPDSVQSGRSLEDVAGARERPRPAPVLPRRLGPELATLVARPPEGPEWLHEIKYDGYRVLCRVEDGEARLYSRNGNDLTRRMDAIARAVERLPALASGWLDGEVVALSADGRTSFPALQSALSDKRDQDLIYYLFDLPWWNGRDLRSEALAIRKQRLATLLSAQVGDGRLRLSEHVRGKGETFYQQACAFGLEGVVSKRFDAPYRSGRTSDWLKVKCRLRQEFVVAGYTDPGGGRAGFGALVLGLYEQDGRLRYCGRVGTGFDEGALRALRARLERLETDEPPFAEALPREARKGVHWVRPETVVDIEFAGWTHEGYVRQASYQGFREDKRPRDVVREVPQTPAPTKARSRRPRVRLTNADKVLYPEQGLTKEELALYYEMVGEWMLPHVVNRPLTLLRCPEGPHKHCFWQKHATAYMPEELRRVPLAEHGGKVIETYLAIDSLDGVLALVQMGVLEIHVWGSRVDRPDHPDRLIFDIDPDPALGWEAVLEATARVYARVLDLGLAGFVRTTGGKGLHVVVPIARRHDWDEAKAFAKALADDIVRQDPVRYTSRLALSARKRKVFIDYLRNARGATAVTNYSTRAKPQAPVAVPLAWEELSNDLRSDRYHVRNIHERLRTLERDPWEDFDRARRAITAKMKRELGMKKQ